MIYLTWDNIYRKIQELPEGKYFGVPRGGAIVAGLTKNATLYPENADYIIDDIEDSGKTKEIWNQKYPNIPFITLYKKQLDWIVFPWEFDGEKDIEDSVVRQLQFIGEDPNRDGLQETPKRVVKSWKELYCGYKQDSKEILNKVFDQKYDQMVLLKDIEMYSTCEHHMIPFVGKAHIAYIPQGKVVGISKLARLLECFARRLQIQERICEQVVDAIQESLNPKGAACIIEAKHFCMCGRGVNKQHSIMTTSALRGSFLAEQSARDEFLKLIRS